MGISGITWATEMVHLSKFAEVREDFNGNTFKIATQLQMIKNIKIIVIFKCTFKDVLMGIPQRDLLGITVAVL